MTRRRLLFSGILTAFFLFSPNDNAPAQSYPDSSFKLSVPAEYHNLPMTKLESIFTTPNANDGRCLRAFSDSQILGFNVAKALGPTCDELLLPIQDGEANEWTLPDVKAKPGTDLATFCSRLGYATGFERVVLNTALYCSSFYDNTIRSALQKEYSRCYKSVATEAIVNGAQFASNVGILPQEVYLVPKNSADWDSFIHSLAASSSSPLLQSACKVAISHAERKKEPVDFYAGKALEDQTFLISFDDLFITASDNPQENAALYAKRLSNQRSQRWHFIEGQIVHESGQCLSIQDGEIYKDGGRVLLKGCNGSITQQWNLDRGRIMSQTNRCLDLPAGSEHNNLQIWTCNDSPWQQWIIKSIGSPSALTSNGSFLTAGRAPANGTEATLSSESLTNGQRWHLSDGQLIHESGKCLAIRDGDLLKDGGRVFLWDCNQSVSQQWSVQKGQIVNQAGLCLDIPGGNPQYGVQVWRCNGNPWQKWDLRPAPLKIVTTYPKCKRPGSDPDGDGWGWENNHSCQVKGNGKASQHGKLMAVSSRKCLEVPYDHYYKNIHAHVQLWDCYESDNMSWELLDGRLRSPNGRCLEVSGAAAEGSEIHSKPCSSSVHQQWSYQPEAQSLKSSAGLCLGVPDQSDKNGSKLIITACDRPQARLWQFVD